MSKENANNTEKVISNVTMEEILANLKDFFTPKINRFNAGTFTYNSGEQEIYCGFVPRRIIVYITGVDSYGDTHYIGCPLWIWEDGNLSQLPDFESDRNYIEINPDGFTISGIGTGFEMQLRWEAYA